VASSVLDEARSTRAVAVSADLVWRSLESTGGVDSYAVEALERIAATHLDEADSRARQGFEPGPDAGPDVARTEAAVLAAVVSNLAVGETLLAAGRAVGEGAGPADPAYLSAAVADCELTADSLERLDAASVVLAQGFDAAPVGDPAQAADRLRAAVGQALEQIAQRAGEVTTRAFSSSAAIVPEKIRELVAQLGQRIDLGAHVGRLVRLGLRAVQRALDLFARLFPGDLLRRAGADVLVLHDRLAAHEPGSAVVGWLVGADSVGGRLDVVLAHPTEPARLDAATAEVQRLSARFAGLMDLATDIVRLTAGAGALLAVVGLAVPHLPLLVAGALLLVVAGVVLLAGDYVDARSGLGFVRGIGLVVTDLGPVPA
jgi:hypothetical protein